CYNGRIADTETGAAMRRSWIRLFAIIGIVLLIDQVTKRLVVTTMAVGETQQPIPALAPFFQITRSANTGSAFGFLPQAGDIFLIVAIVVVIAMLYYYPRLEAGANLTRIAMGLICGGALGNALNRLEYGHVVDFIHYQIPGFISNVSNPADHAIVLGVILIFIDSWRSDRAHRRVEATPSQDMPE
ncbi:MAG: signal peptidase II, partial [Anaerolineae bacterium]|nr:signal peptidase II [Anaerolineae bacterium]